jgi:hypothetical protein
VTKAPQEGFIGNQDIRYPGSESFVHCRITIRDFPIGGEQLSIVEDRWQAFTTGSRPLTGQWPRAIRDQGITSPEDACSLTSQTIKSRWRVWSKAYGSGHLDQGLVEGLARKVHWQSKNRKSHGHKHHVIVNVETPMEGSTTVTWRQWSYGSCSSR